MLQIPSEVLNQIFIHLHYNDKIECMLVCQQWKQIIEQLSLYHTISLYSEDNFDGLLKKIEENPEIGNRIERLMLDFTDRFDTQKLLSFLPLLNNLQALVCSWKANENGGSLLRSIEYPWSEHIKHLTASEWQSIPNSLFLSNYCPNLVTLDLKNFRSYYTPFLENAPALKKLTIEGKRITFDDIDLIHRTLPLLESFNIGRIGFLNTQFNQIIEPANSVTECSFGYVLFLKETRRVELLKYIHQKYPNLSKLTFNALNYATHHNDTDELIQHGFEPLFETLGPQLKKLSVDHYEFYDDIFALLDKYTCRLDYLKIITMPESTIENIENSQQIRCIQTLVLCHVRVENYDWLNYFQQLKKLKVGYQYQGDPSKVIFLNDILDNAPSTLEWLSFYSATLSIDPKKMCSRLPNVKTLSLSSVILPTETAAFISQYFHKLTNLKLKKCSFLDEKILNLGEIDLSRFSFNDFNEAKKINNILVVTQRNNEQRLYTVREEDYQKMSVTEYKRFHNHAYPPMLSRRVDDTLIETDFTLLCNSLANFSCV